MVKTLYSPLHSSQKLSVFTPKFSLRGEWRGEDLPPGVKALHQDSKFTPRGKPTLKKLATGTRGGNGGGAGAGQRSRWMPTFVTFAFLASSDSSFRAKKIRFRCSTGGLSISINLSGLSLFLFSRSIDKIIPSLCHKVSLLELPKKAKKRRGEKFGVVTTSEVN
jgi:hypothetical protein